MRKILIGGMVLLALSVLATSFAFAQITSSQPKPSFSITATPSGNVRLMGTLKSTSGTTLTVTSWGGDWSVDASNAKLLRRFGATSSLSEFQVGDELSVMGTISSSGSWSITATTVRDEWIQVKNANSYGTISNLNVSAGTFTLTTSGKGALQVSTSSNTKIYLNGGSATLSNLANGMMARVTGVWDRSMSTILANAVRARTASTGEGNATSTGR